MNKVEALNAFGSELTGQTIAGHNVQESLNAIAAELTSAACNVTNEVAAIDIIANNLPEDEVVDDDT